MKILAAVCLALALLGGTASAGAEGRHKVTDAERAACEGDAINLYSASSPKEDALLACMKANVDKLTAGCRPVFLQGLRRRGLD